MKQLRAIITLIAIVVAVAANAETPKPLLSGAEKWDNFKYTYISPEIIDVAPNMIGKLSGLHDFPIEKIKMAEFASTNFNGQDKEVKTSINNIISENHLQLLATTKDGDVSQTSWYVKYDGSGKNAIVKVFFVVKYGSWGNSLSLIYLVGNFTFTDLEKLLR